MSPLDRKKERERAAAAPATIVALSSLLHRSAVVVIYAEAAIMQQGQGSVKSVPIMSSSRVSRGLAKAKSLSV